MAMIQDGIIEKKQLLEIVPQIVNKFYGFKEEDTKSDLLPHNDALKDDLFIYFEYPYVDKVYRNSYYSYFSSKHKEYKRDCIRLSFFSKQIHHNYFRSEKHSKFLQNNFLGYLIIRPTPKDFIGRSMLSPKAFKNSNFISCLTESNALVNGVKLNIKGFPHSSQDEESISCAETTIWSLMEYFGSKYPEYCPVLPSDIISAINNFSFERMLPSNGLSLYQISYALKQFGFETRIYNDEAFPNDFHKILSYYIESGIPTIVVLENDDLGHAVVYIGHENFDYNTIDMLTGEPISTVNGNIIQIIDTATINKKYVVIDDNCPPYQLADFNNPVSYSNDNNFLNCKITGFVVPLYEKIYLEISRAKELIYSILKDEIISISEPKIIFRLYLSSSRSFKSKMAINKSMAQKYRDLILLSTMPKFIYVAEISNIDLFKQKKAFGLIIVDATTGNSLINSIILILYLDQYIIFDNEMPMTYNTSDDFKFDIYENNLKGG